MPAEPQPNNFERCTRTMAAQLSRVPTSMSPRTMYISEHSRVQFSCDDDIPALTRKLISALSNNPYMAYENVLIATSNAGKEHGYVSVVATPGYLSRRQTPTGKLWFIWTADELCDFVRNSAIHRVTTTPTTETKES